MKKVKGFFALSQEGEVILVKNPQLNRNKRLVLDYQVWGHKKYHYNICNEVDGYYHNAELIRETGEIVLPCKLDGINFTSAKLSAQYYDKLMKIYDELYEILESSIDEAVKELVNGFRYVQFRIMKLRMDKPFYKAWLLDLQDIYDELVYHDDIILERALTELLRKNGIKRFVGDPFDFVENTLNQKVGTIKHMKPKTVNYKLDKEIQDDYGLSKTIVTDFEIKLIDIVETIKVASF